VKQLDLTTGLDLVGMALISAGLAWGLWATIGGYALIAAGVALIVGSWLASRR
jgi:hypothetical protein